MSVLINSFKVVLLLLCGISYYATWYLLLNNGSADHMARIRDVGPRLLPGTEEPLKTAYIGIEAVDHQLTVLVLFFWELVDGSRPDASLFCFHFAGQVFSGWGLLMIESVRNANLWRTISFLALWGIALQTLSYAVIIPIFLTLHLSTSPTVFSTVAVDYTVGVFETLSIPIVLIFGYALPAVLMSLPAPSIIDFSTKQDLIAFWQLFPLWVSILQPVVSYLISSISKSMTTWRDQGSAPKTSIRALRFLYILLIVVAGMNQVSALSVIALSEFFPRMFAPEYVGIMSLSRVFLPQAITTSTKMSSIGDGAFMLLQYDECLGSLSMALWAAVLLVQAHENLRKPVNYSTLIFYGIVAMALTGPLGFAIACIWARDELVDGTDTGLDKKLQ